MSAGRGPHDDAPDVTASDVVRRGGDARACTESAGDSASTDALERVLAERTAPGVLVEAAGEGALRCVACAHRCVLAEDGRVGACGVRFRRGGELRVPFGYVARRYVRAVETNTVFHVRPGARALTFGMYGCDLRCPYCHNWKVSQALREGVTGEAPQEVSAEQLVDEAVAQGCEVVCSAYNEPMITAEWAHAVFAAAKSRGLVTALISDGHTTREALSYMRDVTDVYRVDLKGYTKEQYRALGGRLGPVLKAIDEARAQGYWVEVVTLVVPGFNDDPGGLRAIAGRLAEISTEIPWHLNAFYPRYKLTGLPRMAGEVLLSAAGTGYARGLKFVYVSNLADELRELGHTRCPGCHTVVVRRVNYETTEIAFGEPGGCPQCGERIAGLWGPRTQWRGALGAEGAGARAGDDGARARDDGEMP